MPAVQVGKCRYESPGLARVDLHDPRDPGDYLRGLTVALADQEHLAAAGKVLEGLCRHMQVLLLRQVEQHRGLRYLARHCVTRLRGKEPDDRCATLASHPAIERLIGELSGSVAHEGETDAVRIDSGILEKPLEGREERIRTAVHV